ncbi:MAG: hypothetical protein ABDH63_00155 [Candidatus Caldarchaeales archaeon]
MPKRKEIDPQKADKIYNIIEEYIDKYKKFCTIPMIHENLKGDMTRNEVLRYVNHLINESRLKVVFDQRRKLKLVAPAYMVENLSKKSTRPTWISEYSFPQKKNLEDQIKKLNRELEIYEKFELLLTSSGYELVDAVAFTLDFLGFKVEPTEIEGIHDLEVRDGDYFAIIEVKGLERWANIRDLRQVVDHYLRKLDETGEDNLVPILMVNHFRSHPPRERDSPFSNDVLNAVRSRFRFVQLMTTYNLYNSVGEVISNICDKELIRKKFKSGELAYIV